MQRCIFFSPEVQGRSHFPPWCLQQRDFDILKSAGGEMEQTSTVFVPSYAKLAAEVGGRSVYAGISLFLLEVMSSLHLILPITNTTRFPARDIFRTGDSPILLHFPRYCISSLQ